MVTIHQSLPRLSHCLVIFYGMTCMQAIQKPACTLFGAEHHSPLLRTVFVGAQSQFLWQVTSSYQLQSPRFTNHQTVKSR